MDDALTAALRAAPGPDDPGLQDRDLIRAMTWDGIVDLDVLLRHVHPAYGNSGRWAAVAAELYTHPSERDIIDVLISRLHAMRAYDPDAVFDEPVRIYFPDDEDDNVAVDPGEEVLSPVPAARVGNGMHRIAALIAVGARTVRVSTDQNPDDPFDGELVQVRYRITGQISAGTGLDPATDDTVDYGFFWLRSFPLTDQVWTEAATAGSCDGIIEQIFHCPHRLAPALTDALQQRAGRHALTVTIQEVRPTSWAQLDADDTD